MSTAAEPASLHPFAATIAGAENRRSYRCYNCNHSFHISLATASSAVSPSSFRCPRCHHRHLLPHHTISPPPPAPAIPPPPPSPPPLTTPINSNGTPGSSVFTYYTSDDSDSDYDYDSDTSLGFFTSPNFYPSTPTLRSFVDSLPIKLFPPNTTPSLQSCSICLEDFEINSNTDHPVYELPCEHYFHKDCTEDWLKRSNTCPLCRFKLPAEHNPEEGPNHWDEGHEADFLLTLASGQERELRRVARVRSLSLSTSLSADRRVLGISGGTMSGSGLDAMHDEEGDTLTVDAFF